MKKVIMITSMLFLLGTTVNAQQDSTGRNRRMNKSEQRNNGSRSTHDSMQHNNSNTNNNNNKNRSRSNNRNNSNRNMDTTMRNGNMR